MADHKISADGQRIECHAPEDAHCRRQPDCGAESWGEDYCEDHDLWHPVTDGHDCWMTKSWLDPLMLDEAYVGPGKPVTIYPGRDVILEFNGVDEGVTWIYAHQAKRNSDA